MEDRSHSKIELTLEAILWYDAVRPAINPTLLHCRISLLSRMRQGRRVNAARVLSCDIPQSPSYSSIQTSYE